MHNSDLAHHATSVETQHAQMMNQMGEYSQRLQQTAMQNEQLQREIAQLRTFISVSPHYPYCGVQAKELLLCHLELSLCRRPQR